MLGRVWLLLAAGITFFARLTAGSSQAEKPYAVAEAYEVYSAVLALEPEKRDLVIATATVPFHHCLESQRDQSIDSAIADYRKANETVWRLQPKFKLARNYKLLSEKEIDALTKPDPQGGFFSRLPDDMWVISLSAVGFNPDRTVAFLEMASVCGGQCGGGRPYYFQKRKVKWLEYRPPAVKNADGSFSIPGTCGWAY